MRSVLPFTPNFLFLQQWNFLSNSHSASRFPYSKSCFLFSNLPPASSFIFLELSFLLSVFSSQICLQIIITFNSCTSHCHPPVSFQFFFFIFFNMFLLTPFPSFSFLYYCIINHLFIYFFYIWKFIIPSFCPSRTFTISTPVYIPLFLLFIFRAILAPPKISRGGEFSLS